MKLLYVQPRGVEFECVNNSSLLGGANRTEGALYCLGYRPPSTDNSVLCQSSKNNDTTFDWTQEQIELAQILFANCYVGVVEDEVRESSRRETSLLLGRLSNDYLNTTMATYEGE